MAKETNKENKSRGQGNATPIADFLLKNAEDGYVSFHMPGHKGARIYREFGYDRFLEGVMDCDITEVIGADNLFKAEGIIGEVAKRYAELYDVRDSYLLVNGTSGGLIAAILSAVPRGGRLIMARNSHKSLFNALRLGGIRPASAYPE
ncbi:MAG: decarboxylase, partial [Firmicutes bacterium]|nr:decarboxylase [Bacillota bacterium]